MAKKLLILTLCLGFFWNPGAAGGREAPPQTTLGAVATQHPLASAAAKRVLKQGGNAMDAAVAAALTLAVVEPYNSGLGAGGMALVWISGEKEPVALDFREKAPQKARADMFQRAGVPEDASRAGPLSIAVPGEAAGLGTLHARWGKLPWRSLFHEAVRYAEKGFAVDPPLMDRIVKRRDCLLRDYHSARLYRPLVRATPAPTAGPTLLVQANLARSLKRLRDAGYEDFYRGELAGQIARSLEEKGALLSPADLEAYRAVDREPVSGSFPWGTVWGFPPPSSGGVSVIRGLRILEALEKKSELPIAQHWQTWLVEALAPVFADRNGLMGDPDFVEMPLKKWLKKSRARRDAEAILEKSPVKTENLSGSKKQDGHTTHLTVMDSQGNGVAMTLTLNLPFGSCLTAGETGIMMNDQMDAFATRPGTPNAFGLLQSAANAVAPEKRPLSSMSPTMVARKKDLILALGSPGGPRIITAVLQVLIRYFYLNEDLDVAIAAPRIHYQGIPNQVYVETGLSEQTRRSLQELGIPFEDQPPWGNMQAVGYDPERRRFSAFSDPRGIGRAVMVDR